MPDIITITFNPCIDKSTSVIALKPEKKLRCSAPVFEPGGRGINVARAIKKIGGEAIAIYPSGGYSGKFLNLLLEQEGLSLLTVETNQQTRENMIVLDKATNQQYRFDMPGPKLVEKEWQECLQMAEKNDSKFIIASGSLPPGVPADIFARISRIAKKRNRKLVVDSTEEALKPALEEGVYMIKPNIGELTTLAGKEELQSDEIEPAARDLINRGRCEIVVVSLGALGAMLVSRKQVFKIPAPAVKIKSTVGAGDSMVAGIVFSISKQRDLYEAIQYGVACGTAATLNNGTGLCRKEDVERLFEQIRNEK
ncbi:1-phosphofructokinase family hexose kinase [Agriterribacter sp.]|uniref:1-phosphofructokinase family hexose kinase n=1 Tax=Agriterribacter sp. TaxID=2821509 RepID=UPI002BC2659E|nr:1-phosphofructokinase family hexose kinase [Agriterribacter sp.]HTN05496.1 1-phosphofructokinase family hexose kinase [Agriterribacter sp.]